MILKTGTCFSLLLGLSLSGTLQAGTGEGQRIHDQHCRGCHTSIMNGKPDDIYTRDNRRVHSFQALQDQIARCEANTGIQLTPKQTTDVIDYLNRQFYKFKP